MMKYFIIGLFFLIQAQAQEVREMRFSPISSYSSRLIEINYEKLTSQWNIYKSDECVLRDQNVLNEKGLQALGLRRCRDGSVSFIQPNSTGWNGWEGKCGQTAASNVLFHYCRVAKDPKTYMDEYLSDITPGVRPRTLEKGLNKVFKKFKYCEEVSFEKYYAGSEDDFIGKIKQRLKRLRSHPMMLTLTRNGQQRYREPVIVLIQNPGTKYLHWVTIVDQIDDNRQCNFIINHWDDQYKVPCSDLADWSYQVGRTYPVILRSYSLVFAKD
jgi:hypothetical protein